MKNLSKKILTLLCVAATGCSVFAKSGSSKKSGGGVDVDLSLLNYNMASAQIFNMLIETDSYMGKTVRIKGQFISDYISELNMRCYSVVLWDVTACCQTGLQFILTGDHKYPDDYPPEMSTVEVTGILKSMTFNGMEYLYLESDGIKILQ